MNASKPLQFAVRLFLDALGHSGLGDGFLEFLDIGAAAVGVAEFLLDCLKLLVQVVLSLRFINSAFDLGVDLLGEFEDVELSGEGLVDLAEAIGNAEGLQQFLAFDQVEGEVRGEEVGNGTGFLDVVEDADCFVGHAGGEFDHLFRQALRSLDEGFEFLRFLESVLSRMGAGNEVGFRLYERLDAESREPVDDDRLVSLAEWEHLEDADDRADAVDVVKAGILQFSVPLSDNA